MMPNNTSATTKIMDSIIDYDTVKTLVANPPSIDPRPNLFNLHALQIHFACTLKHLPCPQSTVNRWLGAVMSKEMYALVDSTPFKPDQKPTSDVPEFSKIYKDEASPRSPALARKPSASPENLITIKITTKCASTSIARSMTHSIAISAMPSRSHPRHHHQP